MNLESGAALWELMRSRRTIRRFTEQRPERALVEELIEAATTAPSASNNQPWRFFVTDQSDLIEAMAAAVEVAVARIAGHVEASGAEAFRSYGDYFARFRAAPVVIVPAFRPMALLSHIVDDELSAHDRDQVQDMEFNSGLASTSLAVQNLLLCAHSRGLGTSCMTGPLVAAEELQKILGIPGEWRMAMVVALGYPAEEPPPTSRKATGTVLRWIESVAKGGSA